MYIHNTHVPGQGFIQFQSKGGEGARTIHVHVVVLWYFYMYMYRVRYIHFVHASILRHQACSDAISLVARH